MDKDFRVWAKNKEEISEFVSWVKRNNYIFYKSDFTKHKDSCGFIVQNKKAYISTFTIHNCFSKYCVISIKEITFEEFKKQYFGGDKMTERKISNNYGTMPKLESGMFVKNSLDGIGVITGEVVVYEDGEFDLVKSVIDEDGWINAVYKKGHYGFKFVKKHNSELLIWELKPCIEVSKKEITEKFDLIDSEYLKIIVTNSPCKYNNHPVLQNGNFIHSVSNGWGIVVGNGIVYKEKGFDYVNKIAYSEEIDAVDKMAFAFEDCGNNKNMWCKTCYIPESKFKEKFNIPEGYDFRIVD